MFFRTSSAFPLLLALAGALFVGCVAVRTGSVAPDVLAQADQRGLVSVAAAAPGVIIETRYATTRNGAGKVIYPPGLPCLVQRGTARKVARAQAILRAQGYGLKVYDAWRPVEAQQALWDATRNPHYVLPPSVIISLHCSGIAVDCTLVDASGREMRLPTGFDVFSAEASSTYAGSDPEIRENLARLQAAMREAGFTTIPNEWWHFEDLDAEPNPVTGKSVGVLIGRKR